jgi:hypothetical protein
MCGSRGLRSSRISKENVGRLRRVGKRGRLRCVWSGRQAFDTSANCNRGVNGGEAAVLPAEAQTTAPAPAASVRS